VKTATENTARAFALAAAAWAGPDDDRLIINEGIEIVTETVAPARMEYFDTIYSGWRFRSDETQAVQPMVLATRRIVAGQTRSGCWMSSTIFQAVQPTTLPGFSAENLNARQT